MPRIAIASPYTMPFFCGNSVFTERLRKGLAVRGFAVDVFNTFSKPSEIPVPYIPDILHTLNADKSSAWAERFLAGRAIPWVVSFTGTDYSSWKGNAPPPHILRAMKRAAALIFFHKEAAEILRDAAPEIRARIRIIPQGIAPVSGSVDRLAVRNRLGVPQDMAVFLLVAGLRPAKNIGLALEAFAEVEKRLSHVRLLLIGPAMDPEETKKVLAMGSGLRCFSYLGARPPAEVREIMKGIDVLINTSRHEGMPSAIQEAMSEGTPVIASAVSGNTALVRHGENGLVFELGNVRELVSAVEWLANDGVLRERLGKEGKRIVETAHSLERELDGYCSVYDSIK